MLEPKLLTVQQIAKLLSIGKSTWWAWVKNGKAPASIKLGKGITV